MSDLLELSGYGPFLSDLKLRIRQSQIRASRAVNRELILLYWDIGAAIVEKQAAAKWGDSVVERIATDLRAEFQDMTGFSKDNLWRMRRFYETYTDSVFLAQVVPEIEKQSRKLLAQAVPEHAKSKKSKNLPTKNGFPDQPADSVEFWQQLVAKIPWGHHIEIMNKVKKPLAKVYYLQSTAEFGWSRSVLLNQIKADAYQRSLVEPKSNNFDIALPEHYAEQADEMMKSRYNLEFLGIAQAVKERDLEKRLTEHLQRFILELGYGFCFIGRQHRLLLGEKDYYVDLLFYHRFLKSLVAFDLKIGEFEPEHAGKMDFYLNLLNDRERAPDDQPSIGIILCAEKSDIEVEYALKSKANPIGVAEYQLQTQLPAELQGKLPSAEQFAKTVRQAIADCPTEEKE